MIGEDVTVIGMAYGGHEAVADALVERGLRVVSLAPVPLARCTEAGARRSITEQLQGIESRVVFVYSAPWRCLDRALRTGDQRVLANPDVLRRAWMSYHRAVLAQSRARAGAIRLRCDALASDPNGVTQALVAADHGRPLPEGERPPIVDLYRVLYPGLVEILDDLDGLSGTPHGPPISFGNVRPGGSLTPGTGVQVVIPCRNDGAFLAESVASVIDAASDPVEVTLVNDGSTDPETLRVMNALSAQGFQVLATEGVGLSGARNVAVAASRTAAVLPLDADNRLRPPLLREVAGIEAGTTDVVFGDQELFGRDSAVLRPSAPSRHTILPFNPLDPCTLLSRRLVQRIGGWDVQFPLWEDWDFWMSAIEHHARFTKVDAITFDYCVRPGSLLTTLGRDERVAAATLRRLFAKHQDLLAPCLAEGFVELDAQRRRVYKRLRWAETKAALLQDQLEAVTRRSEA